MCRDIHTVRHTHGCIYHIHITCTYMYVHTTEAPYAIICTLVYVIRLGCIISLLDLKTLRSYMHVGTVQQDLYY